MSENKAEEKTDSKATEGFQEASKATEQTQTSPEQKTESQQAPQPNADVEAMKKEIAELKKYQEQATPLIQAVYSDPDIQAVIKQKSTATSDGGGGEEKQTQQDNPKVDAKLAEVDLTMRTNSITEFDRKYGIKPEEQEEVHKKMAVELQNMGQDARNLSLDKLPGALERAFRLSHEERYSNIAKSQGAAETMNNLNGQFPNQSGRSLTNAEGNSALTNDQKDWVDKLVTGDDKRSPQDKTNEILKKYSNN